MRLQPGFASHPQCDQKNLWREVNSSAMIGLPPDGASVNFNIRIASKNVHISQEALWRQAKCNRSRAPILHTARRGSVRIERHTLWAIKKIIQRKDG